MALLEVNDLALRRGERLVVDGVSLALDRGAALVLRGPNGAGKTTILRALAGFIRPAAGAILWDGRRIEADTDAHRARLGVLGHAHGMKAALSLRENLAFAAACAEGETAPTDAAIARWGLARAANLPARVLSAGQLRRAALARLDLVPRALWLLDEPATALDAEGERILLDALARHRGAGGIAIMALHGALDVPDAREHVLAAPATRSAA